jgi:hypothetical protein
MTVVRIAVARFELIVETPILAKTAVSPANSADNSAQVSHRIAYHRENIELRHPGLAFGRVHRTYRTDGTYDGTLDIAYPATRPLTSHLSPLTSHLSPLTSHLSPLTVPLAATFRRCTSARSMQLSPP